MDAQSAEQTLKIERAVASLSRQYDVRVTDLGEHRFRITLANDASRAEMRNYRAALEKQSLLDEVPNKTAAAVCLLMVHALVSTSDKPCESYRDAEPLVEMKHVNAKNDRTFEITLSNAEAQDIVRCRTADGDATEESTVSTMLSVGLASQAIFGQNSSETVH